MSENKILASARQVFVEKGLAGARMQSIAERAGVNKALLHYYFRSKEKLYEAVLADILTKVWTSLREELKAPDKPGDFRETMHILVRTYVHALRDNPDFPVIMVHELTGGGKHLPAILTGFLSSFGDLFSMILNAMQIGVAEGRIKPIKPAHIMLNVIGMSVSTFIFKPFVPLIYKQVLNEPIVFDDIFYEERINIIVETLCDGIMVKER